MAGTVSIIGMGDDGLEALADSVRSQIQESDLLVGSEAKLAMVPPSEARRLILGADIEAAARQIQESSAQKVAVLVSGDPLFYGRARFLCDHIGRDRCEIVPHVSSMQLAFARVKESWDEAYLTNLANHPLDAVLDRIRGVERAGLFTTPECGPATVAKELLERRIDYFTAYVCEDLGSKNETVTVGTLAEIAGQSFGALNVMILIRDPDAPDQPRGTAPRSLFGNPDDLFVQSQPKHGLITTAEVRAIALAHMKLGSRSVVWDVGAGSGSVSVEAAQLAVGGQVYAIEQDLEDIELIRENASRFGVENVKPIVGRAPEVWADLPDPDAVFLEGSGREIAKHSELAFDRLRPGGRLVANIISVEGILEMKAALAQQAADWRVWTINIARGVDQLDRLRFDALRPAFLVAAEKADS